LVLEAAMAKNNAHDAYDTTAHETPMPAM